VEAELLHFSSSSSSGANRTDFEKRLYFSLLYLLSAAVCMYVW